MEGVDLMILVFSFLFHLFALLAAGMGGGGVRGERGVTVVCFFFCLVGDWCCCAGWTDLVGVWPTW